MSVDFQVISGVERPPEISAEVAPIDSAELNETVIRPPGGWQLVNVRELWQFRELGFFLAWRDVKVRYKQTVLGVAWAILQPAMMMVVFTIFFGRLAGVSSGRWPYPLFVYAGLLPWTFFATAISAAGNSVVDSERLITKVYFPRLAIPFAAVGAAMVDFAIAFGLLFVLMLYYRVAPGVGFLLVPLIFGGIALAGLGIGTMLAALNVAYRDFRYVIPFLIQLGLFATPTVYMQPAEGPVPSRATASGLHKDKAAVAPGTPGLAGALMVLNPMTALIASFRAATLGGPIPWGRLAVASAYTAALFLCGCLYFRKVEDRFGDII